MTAIALKHALAILPALGYMPMPVDFPYEKLMKIGRPKHEKYSEFGIRHPSMSCARRAKIFAPFDALDGFNDLIKKKEPLITPECSEPPIWNLRATLPESQSHLHQLNSRNS